MTFILESSMWIHDCCHFLQGSKDSLIVWAGAAHAVREPGSKPSGISSVPSSTTSLTTPSLSGQSSSSYLPPGLFSYILWFADDEGVKPAKPQYPIFAVCPSALKISTYKTMRSWNSSWRSSTSSLPSSSPSRCSSSGSLLASGDTLEASGLASTSSLSL